MTRAHGGARGAPADHAARRHARPRGDPRRAAGAGRPRAERRPTSTRTWSSSPVCSCWSRPLGPKTPPRGVLFPRAKLGRVPGRRRDLGPHVLCLPVRHLVRPMRRRLCAQAGQTAAEYMGVLLVVSVIIAAVATTQVGTQIRDEMSRIVCEIVGGDCGEPEQAAEALRLRHRAGDREDHHQRRLQCQAGQRQARGRCRVHAPEARRRQGRDDLQAGDQRRRRREDQEVPRCRGQGRAGLERHVRAPERRGGQQVRASRSRTRRKAIALSPLNRFGIGGEPHIDFPPIESVSYEQTGGISVGADLEQQRRLRQRLARVRGRARVQAQPDQWRDHGVLQDQRQGAGRGRDAADRAGLHRRAERRTDALGDLGQGSQRDEAESPGRGRVRGRCGRPSQPQGPAGRAEVHRCRSTSRPTRAAARSSSSRSTSR